MKPKESSGDNRNLPLPGLWTSGLSELLLSFFPLPNSWLLAGRLVLKASDMMWESKIITCQGFHLHKRQGVRSSFKTRGSWARAVTPPWTLRNQLLLTLETQHSSPHPIRPRLWHCWALLWGWLKGEWKREKKEGERELQKTLCDPPSTFTIAAFSSSMIIFGITSPLQLGQNCWIHTWLARENLPMHTDDGKLRIRAFFSVHTSREWGFSWE